MRKILSVVLAIGMALSVMSGCTNSTPENAASSSAPESKAESSSGVVNEFGWTVPEKTIEFSFYTGDDTVVNEAGMKVMADYLKEKFNVVINRIYYKQDMDERLNLMLAQNDYPDVIVGMSDAMANQFIEQGRALELSDLLKNYAPNWEKEMGNYTNLMRDDEGALYKMPMSWGNTTDTKGRDFGVRYDYWKETGLPMYDSFDSFYEVCKAILEKHPTSPAGDKTYALTASDKGREWFNTPLAYLGFKSGYKEADDGTLTHWVNTDEGLMIAKYINKFYREGMIDPDWQNNVYDDAIEKFSSERVIANIGTWWHLYVGGHETWITEAGYKPEKRFVNVPFQQTDKTPTLISDNYIRSTRTIITDKCKNPEEVMTWFNFEVTPLGRALISNGPPDDTNVWNFKDGKITLSDKMVYGADINNDFHAPREAHGAGLYWVAAPGYVPLENDDWSTFGNPLIKTIHMWGWSYNMDKLDVARFPEATAFQMKLDQTYERPDFKWDASLYTVTYPADSEEAILNVTISENIDSEWAKVVTAGSEAECEAAFLAMRDKLNQLGLKDLTAYAQSVISANIKKFNG